jgi:hypothetical protein
MGGQPLGGREERVDVGGSRWCEGMTKTAPTTATVASWRGPDARERIEWRLAEAEVAAWQAARAMATQMAAMADVLAEAERHPEVFAIFDGEPTALDLKIAYDAAIADLAVRLSVAEGTVAVLAHQAATLRARAPRTWECFRNGDISVSNARKLADTLDTVPAAPASDAALDDRAVELARLAPARFGERMRVLRERLHPRSLHERHDEAASRRRVVREDDRDGMAWLGFHLPAPRAQAAWERIDQAARHLADHPGEGRTLDQLRADVGSDLLTGWNDPQTAPRVTVGVLVPMMTLLGLSDEPATLDGYGPIDGETARRLTAHAPSFHRILTHPVSSTILDVDRTVYRPPADLERWLKLRDGTCRFTGCGRAAKHCDLDHNVPWSKGGRTAADNLASLSRRHHTLKERSRWNVEQRAGGILVWTSPTGHVSTSDPPPF